MVGLHRYGTAASTGNPATKRRRNWKCRPTAVDELLTHQRERRPGTTSMDELFPQLAKNALTAGDVREGPRRHESGAAARERIRGVTDGGLSLVI